MAATFIETSSSEPVRRTRYQSEPAHLVASVKETCRAIGMGNMFPQSRAWHKSVHDNVGVDGDGRL